MRALENDPQVTQMKLAKLLNVSQRTLQRKMDALKMMGKIERVGGKRYGYWKVCK